jgi:hypothetical protein
MDENTSNVYRNTFRTAVIVFKAKLNLYTKQHHIFSNPQAPGSGLAKGEERNPIGNDKVQVHAPAKWGLRLGILLIQSGFFVPVADRNRNPAQKKTRPGEGLVFARILSLIPVGLFQFACFEFYHQVCHYQQ